MREELRKAFNELRNPYVYLWAVASPAITLLPPNDEVKAVLFILLVSGTTAYWLIDRRKKARKLKPDSSSARFITAIRSSIERAVRYLEDAGNKTEHDQRLRISICNGNSYGC